MRIVAMAALPIGREPVETEPNVAAHRGERPYYEGHRVRFPVGTVEAIERSGGKLLWSRLIPWPTDSGQAIDAPYLIDLGRGPTGQDLGAGTGLGFGFYGLEASAEDLGDGYRLRCRPPEAATPAFFCAALLKSLLRAVIAFEARPADARQARTMVNAAEPYFQRAVRSASARQGLR